MRTKIFVIQQALKPHSVTILTKPGFA